MANKKTPDGNQELEPVWTNNKVAEHAAQLYDRYRKIFDEDHANGIETILMDICIMQGKYQQLVEAFAENRKVSSGAAQVSHLAVEKYQQFEATLKTQGQNFSKRLEELEHNGF